MSKTDLEQEICKNLIDYNLCDIVNFIKQYLTDNKTEISNKIFTILRDTILTYKDHYTWECGDCEYDYSGEINRDGNIDTSISILNFLENEYTGEKFATYVSNYGWHYETCGDVFTQDTSHYMYELMLDLIVKFFDIYCCTVINKDDLFDLTDDVYEGTEICYFDCIETIKEYTGLSMDISIDDFLKYCEVSNHKVSEVDNNE